MNRRGFIMTMATAAGAMSLSQSLKAMEDSLPEQDTMMPAFFIGHGSPMNAIEDNAVTRGWKEAMKNVPKPKAILCVSAHWLTKGTWVTAMPKPRTIHDFRGFPKELTEATYPVSGSTEIAQAISSSISEPTVGLDQKWGLDHGAWSILLPVFPNTDVPVLEFSIDYDQPAQWHYELGQKLTGLRKRGVLIIGSGNIVHNLGMLNPRLADKGFDWAIAFDDKLKSLIQKQDHQSIIDYGKLGREATLSVPTPDHYYPLLYSLGLQTKFDRVSLFNEQSVMGSISMTSVKIEHDPSVSG
ncbi:MAG: 4,5-DOPA dioxygenase extradiol [Planctomycetaceae bacterium]|nr:4,5-DOPA dioxygenase extradiol [Planctomycetaceae bacterium]